MPVEKMNAGGNFDDDIYGGFSGVTNKLFNYDVKEDKAFQNAIKTSSYGKKTATPKFYWVSIIHMVTGNDNQLFRYLLQERGQTWVRGCNDHNGSTNDGDSPRWIHLAE